MDRPSTDESPLCPVFGICGGCQYQNIPYEEELRLKDAHLREVLGRNWDIRPIVASPMVYHYRNRLDLKLVKTRRGTLHIGFTPATRGPVVEVSSCPIAMEQICAFLPRLREEAAARVSGKYHVANLTVRCGDGPAVRWGGIGKHSLRLEEKDYFSTRLCGLEIFYSLDTFFQANLSILPVLVGELRGLPIWSREVFFFDLYGGVGLMGLVVHDLVARVFTIEENIHSVRLARFNVKKNALGNIEVCEGRVEGVLTGLLLKTGAVENIVMVDPPRAGLSQEAIVLLNTMPKVRYLLYLSCDPGSLAQNLAELTAGPWQVVLAQPFDFFPRTRHLETLVLLRHSSFVT